MTEIGNSVPAFKKWFKAESVVARKIHKSLIFLSENPKLAQSPTIGDLIWNEISSLDPVDWLHAVEIIITFICTKKTLFPVLEDAVRQIYKSKNLTTLVQCQVWVDFQFLTKM